jgi:hypothetical protein
MSMTDVQTDQPITLILKDQTGDYFLVPREVMERHRVPAEQKAEIEQALAGATAIRGDGADDTEGFGLPLVIVLGWAVATVATAYTVTTVADATR